MSLVGQVPLSLLFVKRGLLDNGTAGARLGFSDQEMVNLLFRKINWGLGRISGLES